MNRQYFGTDGVRGEYGASILTDEFSYQLGKAVGRWILNTVPDPFIVIGRDTRESGLALRDGLARGFQASGPVRVVDLGVLPTPGFPSQPFLDDMMRGDNPVSRAETRIRKMMRLGRGDNTSDQPINNL